MLPGYMTYRDFFPRADDLRAAFDDHFSQPSAHRPETHQVWNYWNVPGQYTYLRTQPEKVLPREAVDELWQSLRQIARDWFGLTHVSWPYLSLYVAGCAQGLHNDATNGRLGYVYSITKWDERRFAGGETLVFHEQRYFGSAAMTQAAAATGFYDLVPSHFNQLLVFDDRLPHAVPRIEGTMIPQEGRVVLHGHFAEGPPAVMGALSPAVVEAAIAINRPALEAKARSAGAGLAGLLTLRLTVSDIGIVRRNEVLLDRLLATADDAAKPEDAIAAMVETVADWRFPAADGTSMVIFAIPFRSA